MSTSPTIPYQVPFGAWPSLEVGYRFDRLMVRGTNDRGHHGTWYPIATLLDSSPKAKAKRVIKDAERRLQAIAKAV